MLDTGRGQARHGRGETDGIGRSQPRALRHAGRHQPESSERGRLVGAQGPELPQKVGRAGLAVGAGDGRDAARLRSRHESRHLRQTAARLGVQDQGARRHAGGPVGALRRQNGRGSARHGIGDIVPSVMRAPRKGCEEIARLHLAAVRGDAADIDISGPRWAGPAVAGSCLHQINEPHRREPGRDTSRRAASWRPPRRARSSRPSPL